MHRTFLAMGVVLSLAACGDPLRGVDRLSDVAVADGGASIAPAASEAQPRSGGLFGRLLNRQADDPTNAAVEAALADVEAEAPAPIEDVVASTDIDADEGSERGGLFGLFRSNRSDRAADAPDEAEVVQAALTRAPQEASPPRGLAGLFRRGPDADVPRNGPDATDVEAGTLLPFGAIARVCGVRGADLGTPIESGGGFQIYDTNPNATARRPFYITGFADNCARTFTGAVTVAGNIQSHEFVRYQASNERISYTTADNAYEALKASVCRVGRGQPCTSRADRLNRNTLFITSYDFFGGTFSAVPTRWTQILLHDEEVVAISIKNG